MWGQNTLKWWVLTAPVLKTSQTMRIYRHQQNAAFAKPKEDVASREAENIDERTEAFLRLFMINHPQLYRYIITLVGQTHLADDFIQECGLVLWKKFKEFDTTAPATEQRFYRWSRSIAFRLVRNFQRLRQSRTLYMGDDFLRKIASTHAAADELLELRKQALDGCLAKLSAPDRELLQICYRSSHPIQFVASDLNRTPASIYKKLRRIRRQLFSCINHSLDLKGHQ
jgi:RNA polymerase sigma-70 factor (ECF subfamily)